MNTDDKEKLCKLCKVHTYIYTCPGCGIGYCSADCYKSQSHLDCSESFYKKCVEDELKSQESNVEMRQRMEDILKRMHEEEIDTDIFSKDTSEHLSELDSDDDDDNIPDLESRLQNVNLDNANDVWSALTEVEKEEFVNLVKSGKVENILPEWTPWWSYCVKKKLIYDPDEDQEESDYKKYCPVVIDVPQFNELQKASSNVCFNLMNVIYSYAYMALYFNGDYMNSAKDATTVFFGISDNMRENKVFVDLTSAIESVVTRIISLDELPHDEETISAFKKAATTIIQGPEEQCNSLYISAALSELHRLLTATRIQVQTQKCTTSNQNFSDKFPLLNNNVVLTKKTLFLCLKKIEYYLSWVKSYSVNIYNQ